MEDRFEIDPGLPAKERGALAELVERLERERPAPAPSFPSELRRRLVPPRAPARALRWQLQAATCVSLGVVCLIVAAVGLASAGPFAV